MGALGHVDPVQPARASTAGCGSTAPTLANIYLGEITNWNDAAIKALNPGCNLPDTKITPVYRSDGSGHDLQLHRVPLVGQPGVEEQGRRQHQRQLADGRRRPRQLRRRRASSRTTAGALTYVDVAYSITNKFQFAAVRNRAGKFATPGLRGINAARLAAAEEGHERSAS